MGKSIRHLGIMTSGGDCSGLNSAIRAAASHAIRTQGWRVTGIEDGTRGLMDQPLRVRNFDEELLDARYLREGGTLLGTVNSGDPFHFPMPDGSFADRTGDFARGVAELGLDALVVIGGDGSMRLVSRLCERVSLPMVGVPKTIDNDVYGTDFAVGFMTALQVVTDALDRLQPTAASHHRIIVVEVMGRDAGHIALYGAMAGGADVALIPEIPYDINDMAAHLKHALSKKRRHALVVVAEGVRAPDGELSRVSGSGSYGGVSFAVAQALKGRTDADVRVTVLGHVQRGGSPIAMDRILASTCGVMAVDCLASGQSNVMIGWLNGHLGTVPLSQVTVGSRGVDPAGSMVHAARALGIYVGNR